MRFADRGFAQVAVPLSFVAVDVRADTGPQAVNATACRRAHRSGNRRDREEIVAGCEEFGLFDPAIARG